MKNIDAFLDKHKITRNRELFKKIMIEYGKAVIDACAEEAEVKDEGTYNGAGEAAEYYVVDKNSILKLKKKLK